MSDWSRVGPWTLRTTSGAVFAVLGVGVAVLLAYAVIAKGWPLTLGLVGWSIVALWTLFWWRTVLTGVFVGQSSIRVRMVATTRTVAAVDVIEVRSRFRTITAAGAPVKVREICLDLSTGRTVSTPVHGDAKEGGGLARHNVLSAPVYDMVVDRLRQYVAESEPPPPPDLPGPRQAPEREPERKPERKPPPGIIEWR